MSKKDLEEKSVVFSALEVAKLCGVVNQTAINWIKGNHLKAYQTPGGQFRVYPEDLYDFMVNRNMRIPEELDALCNGGECEGSSLKILFVDDDEAFNGVSVKLLAKHFPDAQIFQAFDGFEAGAKMVEKQPNCLILDIGLPGIDGLRLCSKIRESDAFGKPEIIVVTGLEDDDTEKKCRDLGVRYYFKKPLVVSELATAIGELFNC